MKTIIITSDQQQRYALSLVGELPIDGTMEVIVKKVDKSSTAKQRRLRWMWMGEIANSGLGRYDTKETVDLACKWQFALPILKRDDVLFGEIYNFFIETVKDYPNFGKCCKQFCTQYVFVKNMTVRQHAEYLTDLQRYWTQKGVSLTDPETQGVDLEKLFRESR